MITCPQCGAQTPNTEWNCVSCRINLYWASQHYKELAQIRSQQGLDPVASTPTFLRASHAREMSERTARGLQVMTKVRAIARRIMQGEATPGETADQP